MAAVEPWLARHREIARVEVPGSVDGGDVLVIGERALIGLSERTNEESARQLTEILEAKAIACTTLPAGNALHLKSSINALDEARLLVTPEFAEHAALEAFDKVVVPEEESYAGNSLWLNGRLIVPAGFPRARERAEAAGVACTELDVSEFRKMDGGLTCLSIRI